VQLNEIEGLHAQVLSRTVRPLPERVKCVGARHVGIGTPTHLRSHEESVAIGARSEKRSHRPLRPAVAINIRGVEERHSRVRGCAEDLLRELVADVTPVGAELPATQSDFADGPAEPRHGCRTHEDVPLSNEDQTRKALARDANVDRVDLPNGTELDGLSRARRVDLQVGARIETHVTRGHDDVARLR